MTDRGTSLNNKNDQTQAIYPQVDMQALEENIGSKLQSEVDSAMKTVETRVQGAVLSAIKFRESKSRIDYDIGQSVFRAKPRR